MAWIMPADTTGLDLSGPTLMTPSRSNVITALHSCGQMRALTFAAARVHRLCA